MLTILFHLTGQHGKILDFSQRLEIAIDVAHGLTYLHLYAGKAFTDIKLASCKRNLLYNLLVFTFLNHQRR